MIRTERSSSTELLADAWFHSAAVGAKPEVKEMQSSVETSMAELEAATNDVRQCRVAQIKAAAQFVQAELDLDEQVRKVELLVQCEVGKDRKDARYKALFPKGMGAVVALNGSEGAREISVLVQALKIHFPTIAEGSGTRLDELAKKAVDCESARAQASAALDIAKRSELAARRKLVEVLRVNEGRLLSHYPGRKELVRSFFRPHTRQRPRGNGTAPEAPTAEAVTA